jgi:hypothetical protein
MKLSEFKRIIREEVRRTLREDYLTQTYGLSIADFPNLNPANYQSLVKLMQQFDSMQDKNDALFDFTGDFVESNTYENAANVKLFYSTIAKLGKAKFPKAAAIASQIANMIE